MDISFTKRGAAIPVEKVVEDLAQMLSSMHLTSEQAELLYKVIRNRVRSKTCFICGKLKPSYGGELYWPDGDMGKPKRFKCQDCKEEGR